jgi:hypothetical protein
LGRGRGQEGYMASASKTTPSVVIDSVLFHGRVTNCPF